MLSYLVIGVSLGLSAGLSPGPLFAMVISQTARYGLREGVKAALSPLVTDLPIVALAVFLLANVSGYKPVLGAVSLAGGLFVAYLAYENVRAKALAVDADPAAANSLVKGAAVNMLSPHPYLFWLVVGGPLMLTAYGQGLAQAAAFVTSFYVSLVGSKIALAVVVNRSRRLVTGRAYVWLMRLLGLALLFFAGLLVRDGLKLLGL
jgi:threonine/homoserine/homoserine lactone efflux protein